MMDHHVRPRQLIRVMGHVLIAFCVEDLRAWWHSTCITSLMVLVFMRCHLSWPDSIILSNIFIHYGDLLHYILYVAMTTCDICLLFLFMAIVLLCIRDCYTYICSHMLGFIIVLYQLVVCYSTWAFITPLIGWI